MNTIQLETPSHNIHINHLPSNNNNVTIPTYTAIPTTPTLLS